MHEVSLVNTIFGTLEAEFSAEELARLEQIDLKVGLLSNVEPVLLQNAYAAYLEVHPTYRGTELAIEFLDIEVECERCQTRSRVENYRFVCSACGTPSRRVVQGEELTIARVHFGDESRLARLN